MTVADHMPPRDRRADRIALAMLPVGAVLTVAAALGGAAVAMLALSVAVQRPQGTLWWLGWCIVALVVAWRNLRSAIEVMSAFDWRPVPANVAWSTAIVVGYPGWWLG